MFLAPWSRRCGTERSPPRPLPATRSRERSQAGRKRLRELAYLMGTSALHITLHDERIDKSEEFMFPEGIVEFVKDLNRSKSTLHKDVVYFRREVPSQDDPNKVYEVEIALQYSDAYHENVFTFVNNINTLQGGTHLVGFRTALTRSLNNWARQEKALKEKDPVPGGDDFKEGLAAVISVKVPDPQFESQTKMLTPLVSKVKMIMLLLHHFQMTNHHLLIILFYDMQKKVLYHLQQW